MDLNEFFKNDLVDIEDIEVINYKIVYKGVPLPITTQMILDYTYQTGMSANDLIIFHYNNSLHVTREKKLQEVLDDTI
jgi:hypothetical protein